MRLNQIGAMSLCWVSLGVSQASYADCATSSSGLVEIIKTPSITLTESGVGQTQFGAGLACTGLSLGLLTTTYLKYRVNYLPQLVNRQTGETLNVNYWDLDRNLVMLGKEVDLSRTNLLTLFGGPEGDVQFYATVPAGQTVSPGTYITGYPFTVTWYYSVPTLSILGLGSFYQSPGFKRRGASGYPNWGSGVDSSINLKIEVLPDCRISTNDVNFQSAAFADAFVPVKTSMGIRCSVKTPYYVSLNNGQYPRSGGQRAMKSNSSDNYLMYEIYKNSTSARWGSGIDRWSSNDATTNAGIYDSKTQQNYAFTVKVLDSNPKNLPAGKYTDTVTVQVEF